MKHKKDPTQISLNKTGSEYICETTGQFITKEKAETHIAVGAKKAIISAPFRYGCPGILMGIK